MWEVTDDEVYTDSFYCLFFLSRFLDSFPLSVVTFLVRRVSPFSHIGSFNESSVSFQQC